MRPRTLLVLTLLVLAMGAFIYFVERDLPTTEERAAQAKKLLAVDRDEVTAIVIDSGEGSSRVRLERQISETTAETDDEAPDDASELDLAGLGITDDGAAASDDEWRLVEPLVARADRGAVGTLLDSLLGLEKERTVEDVDRAASGLESPRHRVTLVTADGEERTLEVGGELPASSDVLVALAGSDDAFQVAGGFVSDLGKDAGAWRDKSLFPGERDDIERLTLLRTDGEGASARVLLARRGAGYWIESPLSDRADRDAVDGLIRDLVALEAERFVDGTAASEAGLASPPASIEVVLRDRAEPFRVDFGTVVGDGDGDSDKDGARWARVDGQLVMVTGELAETARGDAASWRSRAWTEAQVFRVDRAVIEDADGTMTLHREDADWRRGDDKISYSVVSDLLYGLTDAEATELLSPAAAAERGIDLAAPQLTLRLTVGEGEETSEELLRLYPAREGGTPATVEGREVVLMLPAETADTILAQVSAVRAEEPLAEDLAEPAEGPAPPTSDDESDD